MPTLRQSSLTEQVHGQGQGKVEVGAEIERVVGRRPVLIDEPKLESSSDTHNGYEKEWAPETAIRIRHTSSSPFLMRQHWTLAQLDAYLRTFSATHEYWRANPQDQAKGKVKAKAKVGDVGGDVVDRFMAVIKEAFQEEGMLDQDGNGSFEVAWPLVLMMIKKNP